MPSGLFVSRSNNFSRAGRYACLGGCRGTSAAHVDARLAFSAGVKVPPLAFRSASKRTAHVALLFLEFGSFTWR